jgi:peptide/nickel transport system substrate-binding protein
MRPSRTQLVAVVAGCAVLAGVIVAAALSTSGDANHTANAGPTSGIHLTPSSSPVTVHTGPGSAYNAAATNILNPSTKKGGTLRLLTGSDCDSWDPGRVTFPWCFNLQRLMTRTLVGYSGVNSATRLGPDLATSLGRHNADYTQWTYTLRQGLRFENGRPIRPIDIKYGIERLFATVKMFSNSPLLYLVGSTPRPASYLIDTIVHAKSYQGPYRSGDLSSISTTNDSVTFRLARPDADFDYLMALPAAAPVPYRVEGGRGRRGENYEMHPISSGPYEIRSYRPNRSIVFARNPQWSQQTDDIRHPLVGAIRLRVDGRPGDIDRQLRAGRADARADFGVLDRFGHKILASPELKQQADDPVADATQYLAVLPSAIPNVHCRRAIFYALDKAAAARVFGGPAGVAFATSMTPPGIAGHDAAIDPYRSGPRWTGDIARAKAELRECGKPNGFDVVLLYQVPSETGPPFFQVEYRALARVGIKLRSDPVLPALYGNPGEPSYLRPQHVGLALAVWRPAYPTGYGFYRHFDVGYRYLPNYDADVASLHDATVNRVLHAAAHGTATEADWKTLDRRIMASATYLPFTYVRTLEYRNPRLTNVTCDLALASGIYDFVNVGVA